MAGTSNGWRKLLTRSIPKARDSVAENIPFAGAITPLKFYCKDDRVKSVMFEIRRDLYMDETTGKRLDHFEKIQQDITEAMSLSMRCIDNRFC